MKRGHYGQLIVTWKDGDKDETTGFIYARSILYQAIKKGIIEEEYCGVDNKHRGECLNYDVYDYAPGIALVQKRKTTCTKYGNSPQKNYLLIGRVKGKVFVIPAPKKNAIVRQAKKDPKPGGIIRHIAGVKTASELLAYKTANRILNHG